VPLENVQPNQSVIKVYPNPTINSIVLASIGNDPLLSFEIRDISGRVLLNQNVETNAGVYLTNIPIQFLEPGIYFVTCYKMSGIESHPFQVIK